MLNAKNTRGSLHLIELPCRTPADHGGDNHLVAAGDSIDAGVFATDAAKHLGAWRHPQQAYLAAPAVPDITTRTLKHEDSDASHPLVSVIIPVFNERATVAEVIRRVQQLPWSKEILVVDDGSVDKGVEELLAQPNVRVLVHEENRGKGAAIRTALAHVEGDIVVIQDADLEYDPTDLTRLISLVAENEADVVFGSRFRDRAQVTSILHRRANQLLTWCSNRLTGLHLSDMETCYKVMRRDVVNRLALREERFGIEPEVTAKIARGGWRVAEVPIRYQPRNRSAGKKVGFRDGLRALWCILRYSRWN
jgi:glycosyltransferase involved in cell wall biosynthesis